MGELLNHLKYYGYVNNAIIIFIGAINALRNHFTALVLKNEAMKE